MVDSIKKAITKRILDALKKLKKDSFDKYKEFWNQYGLVLKEGPAEDIENKELISGLMMFNSSNLSNSDEVVTFDDYIKNMKSDQEQIYFCVADTHEAAINSPHIEKIKSNGI